MRVAIYARISRDRAGANLGVDRQRSECEDYARERGWTVVAFYHDNDISAYSGKRRPGYEDLLLAIASNQCDVVLCWHTDRLHRAPMELEEYISVCEPAKVPTYSKRAGLLDLSTPSGRMVARQLGAVARYESELRGDRLKAQKTQASAEGKWKGGARPFGWDEDGYTLRMNEAELILTGSYSVMEDANVSEVARVWNQSGILTSLGNEWKPQAVRDVLLRPRNAGLSVDAGTIVGKGLWTPVVPPEVWNQVRRILTDPARKNSPGNQPKYIGAMRYRCGATLPDGSECAAPMKVVRSGPTRWRNQVYQCTRRPKLDVFHVTVKREELDAFVVEKLVNGMLEQGVTTSDAREVESADPNEMEELDKAQQALGEELAAGRLPANVWQTLNSQLADRRKELEERDAHKVADHREEKFMGEFERDPWGTWERMTLAQQRALLDRHVVVTILPAERRNRFYSDVSPRVRFEWTW